jgi:hypothetical protein
MRIAPAPAAATSAATLVVSSRLGRSCARFQVGGDENSNRLFPGWYRTVTPVQFRILLEIVVQRRIRTFLGDRSPILVHVVEVEVIFAIRRDWLH